MYRLTETDSFGEVNKILSKHIALIESQKEEIVGLKQMSEALVNAVKDLKKQAETLDKKDKK